MYTMHSRRAIIKNIGYMAFTAATLSLVRPTPVSAEPPLPLPPPQTVSFTIDDIRKRITELDKKDTRDYCNNMKADIAKYYNTNAFDVIPCSNQDDVDSILSELHYMVVVYGDRDLQERPELKPRLRNKLLNIYEKARNYPDVQKTVIDILLNHYKLIQ